MNDLKVLGTEKIGAFEFTGIEGGFGKDKKAMLVKDIATIHDRPVKAINQAINITLHPHDLRWSYVLRAWQGFS